MAAKKETKSDAGRTLAEILKRDAKTVHWTGVFLIIAGLAAIIFPQASSLATEIFVGWLLLIFGGIMMYNAFAYRGARPFFSAFLLSLITLAAGAFFLMNPPLGELALTLVIAIIFIIDGAFQGALAFELKPMKGWGLILFSAIISAAAGILIASGLPGTSLFVLGLLIGLVFLSTGVSFLMLGRALKSA